MGCGGGQWWVQCGMKRGGKEGGDMRQWKQPKSSSFQDERIGSTQGTQETGVNFWKWCLNFKPRELVSKYYPWWNLVINNICLFTGGNGVVFLVLVTGFLGSVMRTCLDCSSQCIQCLGQCQNQQALAEWVKSALRHETGRYSCILSTYVWNRRPERCLEECTKLSLYADESECKQDKEGWNSSDLR